MANYTIVTEFLLMGFSSDQKLQIWIAVLFLLIYLAALMGNILIIVIVTFHPCLHAPMYLFLKNLSFVDICYISVTVPKAIFNNLMHSNFISFLGCVLQVFFLVFFAFTELATLTAMSYDRYVAICYPLHYEIIVNRGACLHMVAASWLSGGFFGLMHTAASFSEPFSGSNVIPQFFCDIPQLLRISHPKAIIREMGVTIFNLNLSFLCFVSIIISYIHIFSTVLRIPSAEGRSKAFSTCLPHLIVVTFFISTGSFAYLKPISDSPSFLDLLLSLFYMVLPPATNPIIYSLRNKDMKDALGKLLSSRILTGSKTLFHS
ncbi:olfactory receptor 14A16-like [Tachyglossus aculeatus]|uniref:olfactory receptor 14A16-like n=1 Tax=Tachyglossus aculeatus TaxID=9261 RepID=UPI0018F5D14B|nr:olfactory receptor 14A16-like [Tachyglossus aculeatus]